MKTIVIRPTGLLVLALTLSACGGAPSVAPSAASQAPASAPTSSAPTSVAAKPSAAPFVGERTAIQYVLLGSFTNAVTFVPVETGAEAAQGLDISITTFTDTVQIMVSVGSGQLQMGNITLGAAALNGLNRGIDLKILASSTQDPPGHGMNAPAIARTDLYDSGALTTPPNTQLAVLVVNGKFAEQHRDALERLMQVHVQTIRKFDDGGLRRDEQALAIVEKYTKVTPEISRQVPDPYWPKDGKMNVESLQDQQNFYLLNKSVDYTQPMAFEKYIDYSYLDSALKRIGG